MNAPNTELEQRRIDGLLRDTLAGLETVELSSDFEDAVMKRMQSQKRVLTSSASRRWAMRLYWLLTALATIVILYLIGSPNPGITRMVVVTLLIGFLLGVVPLVRLGPRQSAGLLELILVSIR